MNLLFLTNELNYSDGVASHLFYLLKNLKQKDINRIYLMFGNGSGADKFNKTGAELILNKNIHHANRSIKNFASAIQYVYKFVKEKKIDIVHSHNHYGSNIAGKAAKLSNFRTVQTVHGIIPEKGRLRHYVAGHYIAVNDHVLDHLLNQNVSINKISLIYNGVDFASEKPLKQDGEVRIITASRLEPGKGVDTFIKAVSLLPQKCKDRSEFLIAGTGSLEPELKELNERLKAGIRFTGELKDPTDQLRLTHIFVIASESEGLPMTMLEATAAGNLIITSDFKGARNILINGKEGFIFKVNDAKGLSEKIKFAIENIRFTSETAGSFFNKAKSKFNAVEMAEKHYSLYKKILS